MRRGGGDTPHCGPSLAAAAAAARAAAASAARQSLPPLAGGRARARAAKREQVSGLSTTRVRPSSPASCCGACTAFSRLPAAPPPLATAASCAPAFCGVASGGRHGRLEKGKDSQCAAERSPWLVKAPSRPSLLRALAPAVVLRPPAALLRRAGYAPALHRAACAPVWKRRRRTHTHTLSHPPHPPPPPPPPQPPTPAAP